MYYFISFYDWIQQFYIAVFTQSVIYQIQYRIDFLLRNVDFLNNKSNSAIQLKNCTNKTYSLDLYTNNELLFALWISVDENGVKP